MSTDVKAVVREKYGEAALKVLGTGEKGGCCGTGSSCGCDRRARHTAST
ncbi:MAG: hypothetical protein ACT4O1_11700 [Gemmatimonadota bacterium]